MDSTDLPTPVLEVKLDGVPIDLPSERHSFVAIRSYLERLALEQQRMLCWLTVDGQQFNLAQPRMPLEPFSRVEAETMSLREVPAQLIRGALHQTAAVHARLQTTVELVMINDPAFARELWWNVSVALKEPLLTLSLLPDNICGPENGRASLAQLRKWQIQQLGAVIREVDDACDSEDAAVLAEALEKRVMPWLDKLQKSLELWSEAVSANVSTASCP